MAERKKILFVTNVNLASNPRCLKEIRAAYRKGYDVSVLKFSFDNWTKEYESSFEEGLDDVKWIRLNATRKPLLPWLISTLYNVVSGKLLKLFPDNTRLLSYYFDKRSYLIHQYLQKSVNIYDVVIAHNPGAFWPVSNYCMKNNIPYGVDIEDFHPGEYNNDKKRTQMINLISPVLKNAKYISAASPLILQRVQDVIPEIKSKGKVINNVFSINHQPSYKEIDTEVLRIVWFSQYIGTNRGVQDIIEAVNIIHSFSTIVTLIGNCLGDAETQFRNLLTNNKHKLVFVKPLDEARLFEEVSNHHIGLALEPAFSENNNIALSNKIFTYLLCGNAIVASGTDAQKEFINNNPELGMLYEISNSTQLADILKGVYTDKRRLNEMRKAAYRAAKEKYNWEQEQKVFFELLERA